MQGLGLVEDVSKAWSNMSKMSPSLTVNQVTTSWLNKNMLLSTISWLSWFLSLSLAHMVSGCGWLHIL